MFCLQHTANSLKNWVRKLLTLGFPLPLIPYTFLFSLSHFLTDKDGVSLSGTWTLGDLWLCLFSRRGAQQRLCVFVLLDFFWGNAALIWPRGSGNVTGQKCSICSVSSGSLSIYSSFCSRFANAIVDVTVWKHLLAMVSLPSRVSLEEVGRAVGCCWIVWIGHLSEVFELRLELRSLEVAVVRDTLLGEEMEMQAGLGSTTMIPHAAWFDFWRFGSRGGNFKECSYCDSGSSMIPLNIIQLRGKGIAPLDYTCLSKKKKTILSTILWI